MTETKPAAPTPITCPRCGLLAATEETPNYLDSRYCWAEVDPSGEEGASCLIRHWEARATKAEVELDELRREHLRICRMRAGLSLGPVAELLGLERERLGDLEHGRASATDEEWRSIFSRLADAGNTGAA